MSLIRIGTRQSQLALWQAYYVRDALLAAHDDVEVELVGITSQGDKTLDVPLAQFGGKGLFLKELEEALLEGRVDIAVHSMKDVTVELPEGLQIPVICEREDPQDAFVSNTYERLEDLPAGAVVGTCSLRRQCALRYYYPHLEVRNLRGNVNTRLSKLDNGDYDAIVLAAAGLMRLEMHSRIRQRLPVDKFLPAVGQGAVGIECRINDETTQALIAPLNHTQTAERVWTERHLNAALDGGCHVPVASYAIIDQDDLWLRGRVGDPDGSRLLMSEARGPLGKGKELAEQVAGELMSEGAAEILSKV